MNHQLTNRVKLLQKAVLVVNGEFLILKRSSQSHTRANNWDLPGGNSEWPNDVTPSHGNVTLSLSKGRQNQDANVDINYTNPHQADLTREIEEETGIKIGVGQLGDRPIYFGSYFEGQKQLYTIIVGWWVNLPAKPQTKISSEHTQFQWIKPLEFDNFEFGFAGEKLGFIRQMVVNAFNL